MTAIHPAHTLAFDALVAALDHEVASGTVNVIRNGPLALYAYSKSCVYDRAWGEAARFARGLILDHDARKIIATPFTKFFNVGEDIAAPIPAEPFEVFDKLDGSLIVIWNHGGRWHCSTKGSFTSDQARWAQLRLDEITARTPNAFVSGTTYCAEALYPENRIVVRYPADRTGLWLLAAFDAEGREETYEELHKVAAATGGALRVVERRPVQSVAALFERATTLPPDEEGWVLRFSSGLRLKLKGDAYRAIHRAVSHLTPLAVWEALAAGAVLRRELPEEFWQDFDRITALLTAQFRLREAELRNMITDTTGLTDKQLGLTLQAGAFGLRDSPVGKLLFAARKGNHEKVSSALWALVRPTGNRLDGYTPSSVISAVQADES